MNSVGVRLLAFQMKSFGQIHGSDYCLKNTVYYFSSVATLFYNKRPPDATDKKYLHNASGPSNLFQFVLNT